MELSEKGLETQEKQSFSVSQKSKISGKTKSFQKKKKAELENRGDLAKDHELSIAVMNLISIEEHLAFTISKCKKKEYIDIYNEVRKLRSKYMKKIVKNKKGEMWCISKHLLSTTMRLIETGVKHGAEDKKDEAMQYFNDALDAYQLFWLIQKLGE